MSDSSPLDILIGESEQINPAILLAEELMRRKPGDLLSAEDIKRSESTLEEGEREIETIRRHIGAFERASPSPCRDLPIGF
ncbi:MAG: hypothetical protein AB7F88_00560 [Pyrinomonadaceae bacterium]